ncbi:MAG TPA: FMN-binding glutamate synthase family protein [Bacillota bacterium]
MPIGLQFIVAVCGGVFIILISALFLWRPGINIWTDAFVKRLMKDPYPENIAEMYNVFTKVGFQNVLESDLRSTFGEPLKRPFGSPKHLSPWDKLLFNPVYFTRKPTVESVAIDTKVTIGPQAKRPLEIDIPIMIAGMGWGSGLSLNAKIALAKGADLVKTATGTGAGPFLPEERKHVKRLIIQYHRGFWAKEAEVLRQADAIEINLGYGAHESAPVIWKYKDLSPEFRDYMKLKPGEDLIEEATLPNARTATELAKLVQYLRKLTNGVPIGVKLGATHYLEQELDFLAEAGIDFISIAGGEAGIYYGPGILADDVGLPTLPALCRTASYLKQRGLQNKVSLIVSGGLVTPGHFLKALALGADAVAIGTVAVLAMTHTQMTKVFPWEPLSELVFENGKSKNKLFIDKAAMNVANFLKSCNEEIILAIRCMGWSKLKELSTADLCSTSAEIASMTGVDHCLYPPKGYGIKQ